MKIPPEIKTQVDEIVERFNREVLDNHPRRIYYTRYRGQYLYLEHQKTHRTWPVCRLTYTSDMDKWEFAIYKYSDEGFDPDEWMFPGAGDVDGTVEGAMRAGMEAYP